MTFIKRPSGHLLCHFYRFDSGFREHLIVCKARWGGGANDKSPQMEKQKKEGEQDVEGNKSEKEWVAGAAGAMGGGGGGGEQGSELIRRRERLASQPASDIMGCADLQQRWMNTHRDQPRTSLMHAHAPSTTSFRWCRMHRR